MARSEMRPASSSVELGDPGVDFGNSRVERQLDVGRSGSPLVVVNPVGMAVTFGGHALDGRPSCRASSARAQNSAAPAAWMSASVGLPVSAARSRSRSRVDDVAGAIIDEVRRVVRIGDCMDLLRDLETHRDPDVKAHSALVAAGVTITES
jgi:hypothetical protein